MDLTILVFLLGGLFLGWSLGANDAANVFGTAVGTRMIRFQTAAIVCGVFVILGAVISGAGTTATLGKLGSINAMPGAFAACVAAGLAVYLMTKSGLPVSTTQAIVGAIVGWNIYTGSSTNIQVLIIIILTWVLCPVIAGLIAMFFFILTKKLGSAKNNMVSDLYKKFGFNLISKNNEDSIWKLDISNYKNKNKLIEVEIE